MPEGHLVRFIVEVIEQLDVSRLVQQYAGRDCKAYHSTTLLAILVYGYANGVFSSRKLKQATYDSVAFRYLATGSHPDHDTLANFRRRFLGELENLFVQVLELAQEMKLLKVGRVCLDGNRLSNPLLRVGADQATAVFFQFQGKSSWSRLLGQVGSFSSTSQRYAKGSTPFSLHVSMML